MKLKTKNVFIVVIILLLLIVVVNLFLSKNKTTIVKNLPDMSIVAFGDSLIAGNGSTKGHDLVSLLSQKIGEPIINLGVPGDTTALGLARIEEVIDKKPKLVFVLFGGNDFLKNVPKETTFSNLEKIITKLQAEKATVVLLGIQGGVLTDPFAKEFKNLAKKHQLVYIPNVLKDIISNKDLMSDSIHPNDAGYKLIAEKIMKVIDKEIIFID